jgi:hypothetical protein
VRRIGDELALRIERGFQAVEQTVQRAGQRPDLDRHIGFVNGLERRVGLPVQRVGEIGERIQLLVHDAPDDHPAGEQQQQQRHHDRDQKLGRDPEAMTHGLPDFNDDRIADRLIDAHLRDAYRHALVLGFEYVCIVHPPHARALQRQVRIAGNFRFTGADAVDEMFDGVREHRLGKRRHRDARIRPGDLDLLRDRGGEIGQRPVDDMLRVLPREPVRDQAAHQREQRQGSGQAAQQRAAQTVRGRIGHARTREKGKRRRTATHAPADVDRRQSAMPERRGGFTLHIGPMWPISRKAARRIRAGIRSNRAGTDFPVAARDAPSNRHPTAVIRPLCSLTDLLQQITETAHCHDFDTAVLELFADTVHIDFDRGVAEIAAEVREVILQLRLADHAAMTQQQHFEHREFTRRQFERLVVVEDAAIDTRQAHAAERDFRTRHIAVRAAAAHHGADTRLEFGRFERLQHVVVGAGIKALNTVVQFIAGGQHDNRRMPVALTKTRQQRHAVDAGQAQIEDHEFVAVLRESLFGEDAVVDHVDRKAGLFEAALDAACNRTVIFDQKESHGFRSSTMG